MKNWRNAEEASQRPWGPVIVENSPMTKDPLTFTSNVPQGNVSPTVLATQPENHQRPKLPRPPPMNIQTAFHIIPNTCTRDIPQDLEMSSSSMGEAQPGAVEDDLRIGVSQQKTPLEMVRDLLF